MGIDIHAANRKLLEKQAEARAARAADGRPVGQVAKPKPQTPTIVYVAEAEAIKASKRHEAGLDAQYSPKPASPAWPIVGRLQANLQPIAAPQAENETPKRARLYPALAALAHKERRDAEHRMLMLAQLVNKNGAGRVALDALRDSLQGVWTWRRIRQIAKSGDGIFWTVGNDDAIWLHRPDRIIAALGGGRMSSQPVWVDVANLRAGMHQYRATCVYEAFLAGRRHGDNPISQEAIRQATGIAESTQRTYRTIRKGYKRSAAGVTSRRTIKLSGIATTEALQEAAWQRGRGVYKHKDWQGRYGAKGAVYIAHSGPCVYATSLERAPRGRAGKIRKQLSSLIKKGRGPNCQRIYYPDGGRAWSAYSKHRSETAYPASPKGGLTVDARQRAKLSGVEIWFHVPA